MASIARVRVGLTGFPGAPGVCTFYGSDGPTLAAALFDFWNSVVTFMPVDVTARVESVGDILNDADGALTGTWTHAVFAPAHGTVAGGYAAPVGLQFRWHTGVVIDRHHLTGSTFVVPAGGSNFEADGTPLAITGTNMLLQSAAFLTAAGSNFLVWHRPRVARAATATLPARSARIGSSSPVTACSVADKAVVLRSRRD